jgi:hypothetical protein
MNDYIALKSIINLTMIVHGFEHLHDLVDVGLSHHPIDHDLVHYVV